MSPHSYFPHRPSYGAPAPLERERDRSLRLPLPARGGLARAVLTLARAPLELALGLATIRRLYGSLPRHHSSEFLERALGALEMSLDVAPHQRQRIPREGPVVVVANHPFGGADGLALGVLLRSVRHDVRIAANASLRSIPELREHCIFFDPFVPAGESAANRSALREAARWLEGGGMVVFFPAGEVASLEARSLAVQEAPWTDAVARLVLRARASVLPVHFSGRNRARFHVAGLVHPALRTWLLPRELLARRGTSVRVEIGHPIRREKLAAFRDPRDLTSYLRLRTMILGRGGAGAPQEIASRDAAAIVEPVAPELVARDVGLLPEEQRLAEIGELSVYVARYEQVPHVVSEIGRLREITFREAHEGTGRATDLDRFDAHYLHLFAWNATHREVVGAYRMGLTDRIVPRFGIEGLYVSTLFDCDPGLFQRLGPSIELGRSFVRAEYQRSHSALWALWKGIGRFVALHPHYRVLYGTVSMSDRYRTESRRLVVEFLDHATRNAALSELVRGKNPPRFTTPARGERDRARLFGRDLDDVSSVVVDLEDGERGLPVLLRQYWKLGAEVLGFNVDAAFRDALDALLVVDLARTDPRWLEQTMGRKDAAAFREAHGARRLGAAR